MNLGRQVFLQTLHQ